MRGPAHPGAPGGCWPRRCCSGARPSSRGRRFAVVTGGRWRRRSSPATFASFGGMASRGGRRHGAARAAGMARRRAPSCGGVQPGRRRPDAGRREPYRRPRSDSARGRAGRVVAVLRVGGAVTVVAGSSLVVHSVTNRRHEAMTERRLRARPLDQGRAPMTGRAPGGRRAVHSTSRDLNGRVTRCSRGAGAPDTGRPEVRTGRRVPPRAGATRGSALGGQPGWYRGSRLPSLD